MAHASHRANAHSNNNVRINNKCQSLSVSKTKMDLLSVNLVSHLIHRQWWWLVNEDNNSHDPTLLNNCIQLHSYINYID